MAQSDGVKLMEFYFLPFSYPNNIALYQFLIILSYKKNLEACCV